MPSCRRTLVGTSALILLVSAVQLRTTGAAQGILRAEQARDFVGAAACGTCHQNNHEKWQTGRHSKMVQPASKTSVQGDFSKASVTLRDGRYTLRTANGQFFITESYLTGRAQEHRVEYTLGNRRVQHYLTTLDNGQIIILPPSWDIERHEWFHNLEIVRTDESTQKPVQQWNRGCVGCHVSQETVNYEPATRTYATQWTDFGTSCERCHGPGRSHVALYSSGAAPGDSGGPRIVRPTRLDPSTGTMVCAQCHSLRSAIAPGFTAGGQYYDYFRPVLEYESASSGDPSYWVDGRPRRFSNDAMGLWQSQCFLQGGATCTTCHIDPHLPDVDKNAQLAPSNNALCTQCHQRIGQELAAHTKHRPDGAGSSCVECHMPKTVVGVKAKIRDHTISVPVPENTVDFGIPNACNECHTERTAAWAVAATANRWPGTRRSQIVARANAFAGGRAKRPEALQILLHIAEDTGQSAIIRANALGYLRNYNDPRATAALHSASRSTQPILRLAAVSNLKATPDLLRALDDPSRSVRVAALGSLVKVADTDLSDGALQSVSRVSEEFAAMAHLYEDDPTMQSGVGAVYLRTGRFDLAATALSNSLALEPGLTSTRFLLALARVGQHRFEQARALLRQVPPSDPLFGSAQERLQYIDRVSR
jgi:predicted CXXCH cytochrome family protein